MRVGVYPTDWSGLGWYRLRYPAIALAARGHDIVIYEDPSTILTNATVRTGEVSKRATVLKATLPDVDRVVIQRPSRRRHLAVIEYLRNGGIDVVVDIDDNFDVVPHSNQARAYFHQIENNPLVVWDCLRAASRVVASTPALAEHYGAAIVAENCIPASRLVEGRTENKRLRLGWSGSLASHAGDFVDLRGALAEVLAERTAWRFYVVGDSEGVAAETGLAKDPPCTGWLPFDAYTAALGHIDLAICPVADNEFNRSKSWLKPLEFAAAGVPVVTSASDEYVRLGVGEQVRKAKQWRAALRMATADREWREAQVAHGLDVAARWTYEAQVEKWERAWLE